MSEIVTRERILHNCLQEYEEVEQEQVDRQQQILRMMGQMGMLDNVVIGPWIHQQ